MSNSIERWLDNKNLNPFRDFSEVQESFDRFINEFAGVKKMNTSRELSFYPSCEITEEGSNFILKFDMPGVSKDLVKVEADDDQLTIRAERREEKKSETKKKYMSEVNYGSYVRSFTLPGPIDEKKIDAKFENGVLTVTIPKTESLKVKQIPVY